jgi:ligand-binding sensor domain-containing protein/signal transduction histidine kinase
MIAHLATLGCPDFLYPFARFRYKKMRDSNIMKYDGHVSAAKLFPLALTFIAASFLSGSHPSMAAAVDGLPPFNSRIWQIDEGLPDNLVQAIAQTPDGYLWVGTRNGLARFDGVSFTLLESASMPEIKNSSVTALCADRHGALWIGTDGDGLARLSGATLTRYNKNNGLPGNYLTSICETRDGSLWIGTTAGASRFKDGKFANYTSKNGLLSDIVNAIFEDTQGTLWIGTGEGLNRWKNGALDAYSLNPNSPHNAILAIYQDRPGQLWIGSNIGMMLCEHGSSELFDTVQGLSDRFVGAFCEDRDGNLWIGTYGGLNCLRAGRFYNELNNEGAPYDKINALCEDREGNLWVGSREGLIRLNPKRFFTYTKQQGLTHNNIMSMLEDRHGSLWVGTWGGGLDQLCNDKFTAFATTNGFPNDLILALCEAHDGGLWVGTDYDGGLIRFKNGNCSRYTPKDGLIGAPIRVIHEDSSSNVWIGTSAGLSCLKNGKFTNYTVKEHLPYNIVRAICEDRGGNLWIGTEAGLSRLDHGRFTNFSTNNGLSDDAVLALYADDAQNLWIATASGGLNRWHNGRFTAYGMQDGLFSDAVLSVLEDDHGWLWMSSQRGTFRVRKADLDAFDQKKIRAIPCISYGKADGMESIMCNAVAQPAAWKSRDGRLWFPTTKGLLAVVPDIKINESPPPVFVQEVVADKRRITPERLEEPASFRNLDAPIRIPAGRGEMEFHYSALSYLAPEKNRFKYQLSGVDPEWVDAGTRRVAYYHNIYPGHYIFRIAACNNDGVWNETGASLGFVLLPHFWQTWWFLGIGLLAGVGSVGGTVRYISWRKLRQKLAVLELQHSLEKDRARIARDIHDDLGATLTQITLLSELTQRESTQSGQVKLHATQISQTARELVQAMDEIVWAINPRNDNLPRLAGYLFQYAEKLFSGTPLRCRFDSPDDLPEQNLSAETRHHLFLAVKEALNNSARHAGATEVWLRLKLNDSELCISIEDNGRGIAADARRQFGNGLDNMKKRMEEIGGHFELTTCPGGGTTIRFRLPLKS